MPGRGLPKVSVQHFDKLVHALMYLGFAGVLSVNLWQGRVRRLWLITVALSVPVILGGAIELLQPYFPPRTCEMADWLADIAGAMVGFLLVWFGWIRTHLHIR